MARAGGKRLRALGEIEKLQMNIRARFRNYRQGFSTSRVWALAALIVIPTTDMGSVEIPAAATVKQSQRVLVLYSDERLLAGQYHHRRGDPRDLRRRARKAASNFIANSSTPRVFPVRSKSSSNGIILLGKYRERRPDLLIAVSGAAVSFLVKYRAELFTGVPIVYCSVAGDPRPKNLETERIAVVPVFNGETPTLEMALRLHPDTRQVAVVAGSGRRDQQFVDAFREEIPVFGNRVAFTWLTNLSMDELRGALSHLPDHTVVLYLVMFQDATGATFTPRQALDQFAPASRAPIYACYDTYLGHGIVGGMMVTFEEIGQKAARLGHAHPRWGRPADGRTIPKAHQPVPMFDWHQLRNGRSAKNRCRPAVIVRDRELTAWEQHRGAILATAGLCAVETFLIAFLLWQRRRRRLAEASLRDSEQRMTLAVDAAKFGIWVRDLARNEIWASDQWRALFGFAKAERLELAVILERVHPEDRESLSRTFASVLEHGGDYETQYRIVLPGEQVRWISSQGRVDRNGGGKPVLVLGVSRDITARKLAESEIQRQRAELVHVTRVSTMGQLASSLAHELNQPLGAILHNAEAAEIFLQNGHPDIEEDPRHPCGHPARRPTGRCNH